MENNRYLFLFGGNPSQEEAANLFAQKAGGTSAKIALLIIHRKGWQQYLSRYTDFWIQAGVQTQNIEIVLQAPNGQIDINHVTKVIESSTGIFIGGGHTETYHQLYTKSPLKQIIREKYLEGVPVGGNSAGALLTTSKVLLSPHDTDSGEALILDGLDLLSNVLISVHYTKWNDAINLKEGMNRTGVKTGYGIDDNACLVLENEQEQAYLGDEGIYKIEG